MLQIFRKKSPNLVGVDISSTAIKLIELSKSSKGFVVENYAHESLPPNSVVEKDIKDVQAVGEAIARAVKSTKLSTKYAASAVAGSAVITKVIRMPALLTDEEMESQIEVEADRYIPYPLEEINLDFDILGASADDEGKSVDVLLAASRTENVDLRVDALEIGGLKARVVDVEAYAIERMFQLLASQHDEYRENQTVAVIDIGATMTTLNIIHNHMIVYTREQVFGGRQLTEEIQRRYNLSLEEAGRAKINNDLPPDYQTEVLDPFKDAIAQQISRSLQFFFSAADYNVIDHIVLAGGTALIPQISELVEEKLHTSVSVADPFANMTFAAHVPEAIIKNDAPAALISCGLALRSFD